MCLVRARVWRRSEIQYLVYKPGAGVLKSRNLCGPKVPVGRVFRGVSVHSAREDSLRKKAEPNSLPFRRSVGKRMTLNTTQVRPPRLLCVFLLAPLPMPTIAARHRNLPIPTPTSHLYAYMHACRSRFFDDQPVGCLQVCDMLLPLRPPRGQIDFLGRHANCPGGGTSDAARAVAVEATRWRSVCRHRQPREPRERPGGTAPPGRIVAARKLTAFPDAARHRQRRRRQRGSERWRH